MKPYDLYLKGRYFWNKRTPAGLQQAAEYFQQAIASNPNYARAYAGLADAYGVMGTWTFGPQNELLPKARTAALKALQLDGTLAEAHTSLALIAEAYDYDWQTAEKEFRRAIQLNPDYATAHQWYAEYLAWQGRFDEAFAESERARQLDPLSLIIATDHGAIFYYARQYDRAIAQSRAVLEMDPNFPRVLGVLFNSYLQQGRFSEALDNLYSPCGEPFRPSLTVPGLAYLWLRLSAGGVPPYPRRLRDLLCPLLTSAARSGGIASSSVTFCDTSQISRGKFDRLPCTTAGFTTSALDGYGLRRQLPLRPPP